RDRGEDLPLLIHHFRKRINRELGKEVQQVAEETLTTLRQHNWPGNVRELQNVLRQAMLASTGPVLLPEFLPERSRNPAKDTTAPAAAVSDDFIAQQLKAGSDNLYAEAVAMMERQLLTRVLEHTGGNQLQAAKLLGITRGSLRFKLRSLGISIEKTVGHDEN